MGTQSSFPLHPSLSTAVGVLAGTAFLLAIPGTVVGQEDAPDRFAANPEDVESPEAIVEAAYEAISSPAGETRDWDRLRSLFLPEARLIPTDRSDGEPGYTVYSVEEFIPAMQRRYGDQAFHEQQVHAVTERFGDIAHVFSTYETRGSADAEPFSRGINSFQLWYDGDRWWIVSIFWHSEREEAPIPERYGG